MQHYLIYLLIYTNYVKTLLRYRQLCNQYLPPDLVWIEECSRVEVFKTLLCLEVDLSAEPNGQHVRLLTHQLLLSSAFLPSHRLSHSFFFSSLLSVIHARSFSLIFSFHSELPFCGGGVGGVFANHMVVPGASGADVLGIGALLYQAHAYTHTHTQRLTQSLLPRKSSLTDNSII